jgi:hypothetical protein
MIEEKRAGTMNALTTKMRERLRKLLPFIRLANVKHIYANQGLLIFFVIFFAYWFDCNNKISEQSPALVCN